MNACRECNVKRLIYNSSADVVFDDVHDIHGGDESLPYSGQVCILLEFWESLLLPIIFLICHEPYAAVLGYGC